MKVRATASAQNVPGVQEAQGLLQQEPLPGGA